MRELTGTSYYTGGLHTPGACMIQPVDYIRALAASLRHAVDVLENSPVVGLRREETVWAARTPNGVVREPPRRSWRSMVTSRISGISASS